MTGAATAWADPARSEQIIANVVGNARRFARRTVVVDVVDDADRARIVISDDGPGFPEQFLASAFDRFSQADPTRRRSGGSGLGLAIVAALTAAQDGTVEARNGGLLGRVILSRTSSQKQRGHCMKSSILERDTLKGAACPGWYGCERSRK